MSNGFSDFSRGHGTCLIPITTDFGDFYHCVDDEMVVRFRRTLSHETIPGFWRLKEIKA